jgi:ribosomal protein S18 acetylase RimI-like enzyme
MTVRECRADEVDEVLAVWRAAGSPPSVTDSAENVGAIVAGDHAWLLVAEEEGRIAGTLIAAWDGWRGNLYRLAVLPECRRRGIARALVAAGEDHLRAAGARRLAAIVLQGSAEAAGFWTAAGYERQVEAGRFTKTHRS